MTADFTPDACYEVLSVGRASSLDYGSLDKTLRAGLKTADPLVWSVLACVAGLHELHRQALQECADQIGLIQYGDGFPRATASRVFEEIRSRRRVSPNTFVNANAGAALSVCCTKLGYRGPTINLTMPRVQAQAIAQVLAARWLRDAHAAYLYFVATSDGGEGGFQVEGTLVRRVAS
ncbi:conserved hypothetical protein [Thiomonas sp. X19]|uniref:hypothetical protein n=1 Tax=Thiomonas sp. X19 TaxID=1050370 RepID=UPI000B634E5B|nr:hypothetical protein [Thiomonas sp. X19]SCC93164.1 conserved hypothetical protein [Thiomonas sp. X19]